MQQTEEDYYLASIGLLIGSTGILPTDQRFKDLLQDQELLMFTIHWLEKVRLDNIRGVLRMLGIYVEYSDIANAGQGLADDDTSDRSKFIFNIPALISQGNVDILSLLRKNLKPPKTNKTNKSVQHSFFDISKVNASKFYDIIKNRDKTTL